jgi:polyisoprenoid-binding protein YceI
MDRNRTHTALLLAVMLPAIAAFARTDTRTTDTLDLQPESRLWVAGTSTVRSFQCQAGSFDATVTSSGSEAVAAVLAGEKAVSNVQVTVPAEKLDCRNGTMNEHMRKALKVKEFPTIAFRAAAYELTRVADSVAVTLTGTLTLGGVEKPVTVTAIAKPGPTNGTLLVSGTREVRMSEFGLKAPTLMLGTMKVDDRVTVGFDIALKN